MPFQYLLNSFRNVTLTHISPLKKDTHGLQDQFGNIERVLKRLVQKNVTAKEIAYGLSPTKTNILSEPLCNCKYLPIMEFFYVCIKFMTMGHSCRVKNSDLTTLGLEQQWDVEMVDKKTSYRFKYRFEVFYRHHFLKSLNFFCFESANYYMIVFQTSVK